MAGLYSAELRYGLFRRKRITFDFDMLAWFILYDELGWDFNALQTQPPEQAMTMMLYAAAKSAAVKSGGRMRHTVADIVKILEGSRTMESERLKGVFAKSAKEIPAEISEKLGGGEGGKKKQIGMTS